MTQPEGAFVLPADLTIQTRRAQNLNPALGSAIRIFCETHKNVAVCYVLDGRRPDTGKEALIIAVTMDGGEIQLSSIAAAFQATLKNFPDHVANTFLMSSDAFVERYSGFEFYVRYAA